MANHTLVLGLAIAAALGFGPYLILQLLVRFPWLLPVVKRNLDDPDLLAWDEYVHNSSVKDKHAVVAKRMLTPNETHFFKILKKALPEYEVVSQVAMGALIKPVITEQDPEFWKVLKSFQGKIIDYVLVKKQSSVHDVQDALLLIELDDKSHEGKRDKDAARDALMLSAGYPTIRWESKNKPTINQIRYEVGKVLGVSLPPLQ